MTQEDEYYEVIKQSYKIVLKIAEQFYAKTDYSRASDNEAHHNLGILSNYLYSNIKIQDME